MEVYDEEYFRKHYSSVFYRRFISLRNRFIKREIRRWVSSGKFLEVGFGDDNLIRFFKDEFEVFGIDISTFAVNKIKKKYKRENFKACDVSMEIIPFPYKFDVICSVNTIEHLKNPIFALSSIFGSLREGGVFGIYLPTRSNILSKIQYGFLYDVEEHIFRPSLKLLRQILREIGFYRLGEYAASFFPFKISCDFVLNSFNLYFGVWGK
jgi:SAM-dependent methyltransferase